MKQDKPSDNTKLPESMKQAICNTCLLATAMKDCNSCPFNKYHKVKKMNSHTMTHDEMRFFRREMINEWIQHNRRRYLKGWRIIPLKDAKRMIRESEIVDFGYELRSYAYGWNGVHSHERKEL